MTSPKRFVVALALAGACTTAAAEQAAAVPAVVADGVRLAAWSTSPTQVVVYDDRTQRRRKVRVPDCPLSAVGSGRLLMACGGPFPPLPVVVDIRTGRRTELHEVRLKRPFIDGNTNWIGVGREGILANVDGYHWNVDTGFAASDDEVLELDDPRTAVDLDRPQLTRPLCAPLRRTRMPDDPTLQGRDPYVPLIYARPWAVETVPVYRREGRAIYEDAMVRAWRCGERRPRILAKSCGCEASFGAGLVAWRQRSVRGTDFGRVRAVDLAGGRRRSWRVGSGQDVAQAGRTLIVWSPNSEGTVGPSRLRLIRWPR